MFEYIAFSLLALVSLWALARTYVLSEAIKAQNRLFQLMFDALALEKEYGHADPDEAGRRLHVLGHLGREMFDWWTAGNTLGLAQLAKNIVENNAPKK